MSDVAQGPNWWQASDGKWYPPQGGQAPPPPAEQPKKPVYKRVWFWLLIVVVVLFGGCAAIVVGAGTAVNNANKAQHTVVYSVTGDGTADLTFDTYANGNSGTSQVTGQSLPWTKTIVASGLFNIYSVSATISTGTTATCTITVDGKVLSTHTSSGQFATADCNASNT
ncbi:MAG TPA: MmpS family transport accessory protein [Acidimicrobiales bacterium]|nr:MmpS family transport accessory protein [Acidimicrobiales bacterium]